jgi:hypothetical protein
MNAAKPFPELLDKLVRLRAQLWIAGNEIKVRVADKEQAASLEAELPTFYRNLWPMLKGQDGSDSCIMPLSDGPIAYRVYALHASQGSLTEYRYVARELASHVSFFGFQQVPGDRAESVRVLAQKYCQALLNHHDGGPFALFGVSNGGVLAMEMASLLVAQGVSPRVLILGDTFDPAPGHMTTADGLGWYGWISFVDAHCGRVWLSVIGRDSEFWRLTTDAKLRFLHGRLGGRFTASWTELEELVEIHRCFLLYCQSYERYEFSTPPVPVVYLHSMETPVERSSRIRGVFAKKNSTVLQIEGKHMDLVRPHGAASLAKALIAAATIAS